MVQVPKRLDYYVQNFIYFLKKFVKFPQFLTFVLLNFSNFLPLNFVNKVQI